MPKPNAILEPAVLQAKLKEARRGYWLALVSFNYRKWRSCAYDIKRYKAEIAYQNE